MFGRNKIEAKLSDDGVLRVRMPKNKAENIVRQLEAEGKDLLRKEIMETGNVFVFSGPLSDWREDYKVLRSLSAFGVAPGLLAELAKYLDHSSESQEEIIITDGETL